MGTLEQLKQLIHSRSEEELSKIISHAALRYDDNTSQTISFVFWICYMAEQDLKTIIQGCWNMSKIAYPENSNNEVIMNIIKNEYGIDFTKIDPEHPNYSENNLYFKDLIDIYEKFFNKTNLSTLFWKLKDVRNDLSHGRIEKLTYNNNSLYLRETKEEILEDYFTYYSEKDNLDTSPIWNSLSTEEKKAVEEKYKKIIY